MRLLSRQKQSEGGNEMTDYGRYDGMDIDELEFEAQDIRNAIKDYESQIVTNTKTGEIVGVGDKICDLYAELAHVEKLIAQQG